MKQWRIVRLAFVTSAIALGFLTPVQAATSDWATSEGGRMRLIALPADDAGHIRGALQIEPKPGWITYWREPGESGIPPQIGTTAESAATIGRIDYPAPKQIAIGAIREIGYDAPVALPIDFQFGDGRKQGALAVTAFVGLCKDVCIPFQANFSIALPAAAQNNVMEQTAIAAAEAGVTEKPSDSFSIARHQLSADGKMLSLQLTLPSSDGPSPDVYLTGPSGYAFFRQTSGKRDGQVFSTDIAIGKLPKNYEIHGKSWGILVVDGKRAMETTLAFE